MLAKDIILTEQAALTPPPEEAVLNPVPFGIWHLDLAFPAGVKPTSPQLNVIQGGSGARKTSLMLNIILKMCLSGNLPEDHIILYDTLENGMTIERLILTLRCMVATLFIIYKQWLRPDMPSGDVREYLNKLFAIPLPILPPQEIIGKCLSPDGLPECVFTVDFIELWYRKKIRMTPNQIEAWLIAGDVVSLFPLEVFGVSEHYDREEAARRSIDTADIEQAFSRWLRFAGSHHSVQVISDYLTAYWIGSGDSDHYAKQKIITPYYDRFVKSTRNTLWAINQEGVGHQREFRNVGKVLGSSGGDVLMSASQNNWRVSYNNAEDPYHFTLHSPVKSRRGNHGDIKCMIEPKSGVIFGRSMLADRR